ncbi:MAG: oxidoreductase-like domain-containing protein [Xanthomonadaceae bacterium]|jgi:hypothetical protein|nr:oxidoreductase-like domain-containing protein [Xanthomonadaceae bacterium]
MAAPPSPAIPPPEPPLPGDCCGNGCSPCVWDLHEEALAAWRRAAEIARADAEPEAGA